MKMFSSKIFLLWLTILLHRVPKISSLAQNQNPFQSEATKTCQGEKDPSQCANALMTFKSNFDIMSDLDAICWNKVAKEKSSNGLQRCTNELKIEADKYCHNDAKQRSEATCKGDQGCLKAQNRQNNLQTEMQSTCPKFNDYMSLIQRLKNKLSDIESKECQGKGAQCFTHQFKAAQTSCVTTACEGKQQCINNPPQNIGSTCHGEYQILTDIKKIKDFNTKALSGNNNFNKNDKNTGSDDRNKNYNKNEKNSGDDDRNNRRGFSGGSSSGDRNSKYNKNEKNSEDDDRSNRKGFSGGSSGYSGNSGGGSDRRRTTEKTEEDGKLMEEKRQKDEDSIVEKAGLTDEQMEEKAVQMSNAQEVCRNRKLQKMCEKGDTECIKARMKRANFECNDELMEDIEKECMAHFITVANEECEGSSRCLNDRRRKKRLGAAGRKNCATQKDLLQTMKFKLDLQKLEALTSDSDTEEDKESAQVNAIIEKGEDNWDDEIPTTEASLVVTVRYEDSGYYAPPDYYAPSENAPASYDSYSDNKIDTDNDKDTDNNRFNDNKYNSEKQVDDDDIDDVKDESTKDGKKKSWKFWGKSSATSTNSFWSNGTFHSLQCFISILTNFLLFQTLFRI